MNTHRMSAVRSCRFPYAGGYVEAVRLAGGLLRAGWPVIVNGSFSQAAERAEARAVAPWPPVHGALVRCAE